MLDENVEIKDEIRKCHPEHREGFSVVHFSVLILALIVFASCTDYVQQINNQKEDFIAEQIAESESSAANKMMSSSSDKIRSSSSKITFSSSSTKLSSSSVVQQKSSTSKTQRLSSSSKIISSSSAKKIVSSSSAKSSSSIKSSDSIPDTIGILIEEDNEKSSSSKKAVSSSSSKQNIVSSSNEILKSSSSSKASWAYLNPAISYGEIIDERDGQVYKTVVIGEQTWMAENLNYRVQNSHCYDCDMYGRLYSWSVAMDSAGIFSDNGKGCSSTIVEKNCVSSYPVRGICPQKWHLPDSSEWNALIKATSKGDLKTRSGWYNEKKNGSDTYGFSGYPVGYWYAATNTYGNKSSYARFWSSSENTSVNNRYNAYYMYLSYNVTTTFLESNQKEDGFSVRCIKD